MEDVELLRKRFAELAHKSYNSGIFLFTDFLGLAEQSILCEMQRELCGYAYSCYGGADGAERVVVRFGDGDAVGYELPYPIVCIKAEPIAPKFADRLTHRDFLGALLSLGIERAKLGDIPILNNVGYIFAKEEIAPYIISELRRVKRTDVRLSLTGEAPIGELYKTERKTVQANGERLDAIIAKVYALSRDEAQALFLKKSVFVNGRLCENTSHTARLDDIISVRGYGRMIYRGYESKSRKGKLNIALDLYV